MSNERDEAGKELLVFTESMAMLRSKNEVASAILELERLCTSLIIDRKPKSVSICLVF